MTKIESSNRRAWFRGLTLTRGFAIAVVTLALTGVLSPVSDELGQWTAVSVAAEEAPAKKAEDSSRVPSLSEAVYKKLGEGQEAIDAKDLVR